MASSRMVRLALRFASALKIERATIAPLCYSAGHIFLFSLERCDRRTQSVRVIGSVIIAVDRPLYIGRLLLGADAIDDKSELVAGVTLGQNTLDALEKIADC